MLISRGLIANKEILIHRLKSVNYYRLSGYLFPYRQKNTDTFLSGTTLDVVWNTYTFDRQFRLIIMDAIERVEVSVKTYLTYHFTHEYGPFGYAIPENLPNLKGPFDKFYQDIRNLYKMNDRTHKYRELFIEHFFAKYSDKQPPLWMVIEMMSFGLFLTFYNGVNVSLKKQIADEYEVHDKVFASWLISIHSIRNICAHHGRLWNRTLGYKPVIPNKMPEWHIPFSPGNEKIFCILLILKSLLKIVAPQSSWPVRVENLFNQYPQIPIKAMGFPPDWKNHAIWKQKIHTDN